jgi:hypothetical protein
MTRLVVVGLAIALNVAIMVGGIIWAKRQVKLVAAERAAAYRALFALEPLPPAGDEVQILIDDKSGTPAEIAAVHWPYLGWVDAVTLLKIEDEVLGWRGHPFRERRQADPAVWPREKRAAELKRLYGSGARGA